MTQERVVHQPIHPAILPRLDPDYVRFHNEVLQYIVPPHILPWDPSLRQAAIPGASTPLEVGKTEDFDLTHAKLRAFTPKGEPPISGWPVLLYFHGGGWTFGNRSSEAALITNICNRANCVVASVDYRLAPENKYPAAVEDAVESLDWIINSGSSLLRIDQSKIAVGGCSSGGNLAAILALKAAERNPHIPLVSQLLIVPVIDNTASINDLWRENRHTCWLTPDRMDWFKKNYFPNKADWTNWDASPIFAPAELVKRLPKAWFAIAELDILANEGLAYAEKLRKLGVPVEVEVYNRAPHIIMVMDGELATRLVLAAIKLGAKLVSDAANAVRIAFDRN